MPKRTQARTVAWRNSEMGVTVDTLSTPELQLFLPALPVCASVGKYKKKYMLSRQV